MGIRWMYLSFLGVLVFLASAVRAEFPGEDIDGLIEQGQRCTLSGEYAQALAAFDEVSNLRPGHPAGSFYKAAVWERRMADLQEACWESVFYALVDSAIAGGERLIQGGTEDPWVYAFVGAACGLKGVYEAQQERWWTAFRDGWQGVKWLREALGKAPDLCDAYVGMGTYLYWRGKMTHMLTWLPFVRDERTEGIRLLEIAAARSRYSRDGARCQLLWIFSEEGRFGEAMEIGQELYAQYPKASIVAFGFAAALLGGGRLSQAEEVYSRTLRIYAGMDEPHPHAQECRWGLAKVYFQRGDMDTTETECRKILEYSREGRNRWSDRKLRQVRRLLEEARRRR